MASQLTATQLNALFNILTHAEAFSEVRDMRYESNFAQFGPPLTVLQPGAKPAFPQLQLVVSKFIGAGLFTEQAWADICALIQRLCAANLSDSYDKGFMGLRKNAAAGMAAAVESVARGVLAHVARDPDLQLALLSTRQYEQGNAQQLEQAWEEAVQGMLYGDLLDRVFDAVKTSASLDDVPPVARAALDYLMISAATLMHYALVMVPDGQTLVKIMDTIDTLTPYTIIKQTVRVGNVESMLKGLVKVLLAKVGDKNLIQTMASRALKLDLHDLEKKGDKIKKKGKDGKGVPKEVSAAIEDYVTQPRSTQEQIRLKSQTESKSIIISILEAHYPTHPPQAVQELDSEQLALAQEYLCVQLSIRDRLEGVQAICKEKPDLLSPIVKEQVALVTPLLKALHDGKFDIGQIITLMKAYMEDFIKTAKVTKSYTPGVADFYGVLQRQMPAIWKTLHEGAVKCPSLHTATYGWCSGALEQFRTSETQSGESRTGATTSALQAIYAALPAGEKAAVQSAIDAHSSYLATVRATNQCLLQEVLDKRCAPDQVGPSPLLPRWQALLDSTLLTPAEALGQVRTGQSVNQTGAKQGVIKAPDSSVVVAALGRPFREYLWAERSAFSMGDMASNLPQAGGYAKNGVTSATSAIIPA